jgi:dimethylargininase
MRNYGSQSMIGPLRKVLVKRPDEAFAAADPVQWHYAARPKLERAQQEHGELVALLRRSGVEVFFHDTPQPGRADAIYVYDPALVTDAGAILLSMGKELRRGEEASMGQSLQELGIPVLCALHGEARAEGGDLLWLDHDTLAVGLGFRTNAEGLRQLQEVMEGLGVTVFGVDLPHHTGPEACLHLLSLISMFVEVSPQEFKTMGTNVLALAPGHCLMLEGNPVTQRRLEAAGCTVLTYRGNEISLKAEGGPTCLTRPILREYV